MKTTEKDLFDINPKYGKQVLNEHLSKIRIAVGCIQASLNGGDYIDNLDIITLSSNVLSVERYKDSYNRLIEQDDLQHNNK